MHPNLGGIGFEEMKGMKGKLLKKLKSMKPVGYLKQDRVLQVNAADGFTDSLPNYPCPKFQTHFFCRETEQENAKDCIFMKNQGPDVIDVEELMKDLEEEEEEMEVDEDGDDKENIGPPSRKENLENPMKLEQIGGLKKAPLSEIDTSSFRRPDLNSGSLFDPNLLAAFEQAVKEHIRIEKENFERRKLEAEREAKMGEENLAMGSQATEFCPEKRGEEEEEERPLKTRRIEEEEEEHPLMAFEEKCPPGGEDSVIFYTTTLRGVRKTFEDCSQIRFLLESFRVIFFERDVSMHMEFKDELWRVLDGKVMPPRLFIKGRYIGGAEEVLRLHEQGKFRVLFEGIPIDQSVGACEACGGVRFVVCFRCNGSHRIIEEDGVSSKCENCNENGLIICPLCC